MLEKEGVVSGEGKGRAEVSQSKRGQWGQRGLKELSLRREGSEVECEEL